MSNEIICYYAWLIRGLGGIVNLLVRVMEEEKPMITEHWLGEIRKETNRLQNLIKQYEPK